MKKNMDRGDSRFVVHESFKDLKARRAEQEAYRKALEEQIMQRKQMQEEEREREKYENRKLLQNTYHKEQVDQNNSMRSEKIPPPTSFRNPHPPNPPQIQQYPSPHNIQPIIQHSPSASIQGEGRPLQNMYPVDSFNEPHPAAFVSQMENDNYTAATNESTTNIPPCSPSPVPHIPPDCLKYIKQVMPSFTFPPTMTLLSPAKDAVIPQVPVSPPSPIDQGPPPPSPKNKYNDQPFSSGTSSESSSYEDVSKAKNVPLPKIHVSQTSEQLLPGVKVSRTQYRVELQQQIEDRRRREEEHRKKEQEEEERIQEKIRIEQEKMQREYEEELRKQQEKELEAEKKRLASLGKHSEVLKKKAEEKMKAREAKFVNQPPSQREALNVRRTERDEQSLTEASSSESTESIQSICDFFDTTMSPSPPEPETRESGKKFVNPDDRIIPVVANRLKEEAERRALELESSKLDDSYPVNQVKEETSTIQTRAMMGDFNAPISKNRSNNNAEGSGSGEPAIINRSLTARVSSVFDEAMASVKVPPRSSSGIDREMSIRSAPCSTTEPGNPTGRDFLTSLKFYLEDEKSKLMERIQARGSRSNEGF